MFKHEVVTLVKILLAIVLIGYIIKVLFYPSTQVVECQVKMGQDTDKPFTTTFSCVDANA